MSECVSDSIHIVLAPWDLTDEYNRHCGVTMVSILENTESHITFHLLYDDSLNAKNQSVASKNRNNYSKICETYDANISFHVVHIDECLHKLKNINLYSIGSLLRLYIVDNIFGVNKIIYLDSDIVVNLDISSLWKYDISEYYVAAKIDNVDNKISFPSSRKKYYSKVGIDVKRYFNSGVLLLNLDRIRDTMDLSNSVGTYLLNHTESGWPDQDALNYLLQDKLLPLPDRYNYYACGVNRTDDNYSSIFHFAGINKPWKIYWDGVDEYYWKYLLLTPWGNNPKDMLLYARTAPNEMYALNILSDWILFSTPKTQLNKIWLIIKSVICKTFINDLKFIWKTLICGRNYIPKR